MRSPRAVLAALAVPALLSLASAACAASTAPVAGRAPAANARIDPRPARDTVPGPRLRATVAGPCPASDNGAVGVRNTGADLPTRLVPSTPPTAARVCAYAGLNAPHDFALVGQRTLGAGPARRIATAAAAVRLGEDAGAVFSCPADDGTVAVIALAYPARPDVDLWFAPTGCPRLANGQIQALAFTFGGSLQGLGG